MPNETTERTELKGELTKDGHVCITGVLACVVGHFAGVFSGRLLVVGAQTLQDAGALGGGDVVFVRGKDLLAVFEPVYCDLRCSSVCALQSQWFALFNRHVLQPLNKGCRL